MNAKMWIWLGLFVLPVIWMSMVLMNFVDFNEIGFWNKNKNWVQWELQDWKTVSKDWWITETIDEKEISYRFWKSFSKCGNIDTLIAQNSEGSIAQWEQEVTRIAFLKTILTVHCIDYQWVDASDVDFIDVWQNATETREIIKAATILWISNGYEVDAGKEFRANTPVTKIEALTMLINLADLQVQGNAHDYAFSDVKQDWQKAIANTSVHLWLTNFNIEDNTFSPKQVITKQDAQDLLLKITAYYR